jgi:hypothetical protein
MPRLLLIAGTGRNSGKTTLACQLIKKYSSLYSIVAIKISPHFHKNPQNGNIIISTENFILVDETDPSQLKDSSRMLAAGARKSFFIMTEANKSGEAFHEVLHLLTDKDFIVCESGGLRNFVKPGLFLMMHHINLEDIKPETVSLKALSDCFITFDSQKINFNINSVTISENRWKLEN